MKVSTTNIAKIKSNVINAVPSCDIYASNPTVLLGRLFLMPDNRWYVYIHDWVHESHLFKGACFDESEAVKIVIDEAEKLNAWLDK